MSENQQKRQKKVGRKINDLKKKTCEKKTQKIAQN